MSEELEESALKLLFVYDTLDKELAKGILDDLCDDVEAKARHDALEEGIAAIRKICNRHSWDEMGERSRKFGLEQGMEVLRNLLEGK